MYDGHGGAEVALYCAEKLPAFLKLDKEYIKGNYEEALRNAFIGFDRTLVEESVIEELKQLIPAEKREGESETEEDCDGEDDMEDLAELCQESSMPLTELLEKYKDGKTNELLMKLKKGEASGSKPNSPFLRGRRNQNNESEEASGSRSSISIGGVGPSSSSTSNKQKKPDCETEETAVSSSSTSGKVTETVASSNIIIAVEETVMVEKSTKNSPTSSSNVSIKLSDKINCSSPDSSSTNLSNQSTEVPASSSSAAISALSEKSTNGEITSDKLSILKKNNSQENEISTNSIKAENVSSSGGACLGISGGKSENGTVSSNTALKAVNKISSSNQAKETTKTPGPIQDDDDSTSEDEDDGSYNEDKSSTEDGDDAMGESDDDEEEDDTEDEDEEEMFPEDEEDDCFLNSMVEGPGSSSGCTAVVALLVDQDLFVANAGDSRCVVCRDGKALDMSVDHKPEDAEELLRINKAGGRVTLDGRVNGGLNLSRAIGDHAYKMVIILLFFMLLKDLTFCCCRIKI